VLITEYRSGGNSAPPQAEPLRLTCKPFWSPRRLQTPISPAQALGRISRSRRACLHRAQTPGHGVHCLLLRDGGRPQSCMMTHEDYLEQCVALTSLYRFVLPGVRYLSICRRIMPSISMLFFRTIHVRWRRRAFANFASRIRARAFPKYKITYVSLVPLFEKLAERVASAFRCAAAGKTQSFRVPRRHQQGADEKPTASRDQPRLLKQVHEAFGGSFARLLLAALSANRRRCNFSTISEFLLLTDTG